MTIAEFNAPGPRFIVVEGPIGVGKTSLAERLAESFDADLICEHTEDNPFLEEFYKSGRRTALPAQLHIAASQVNDINRLANLLFRILQISICHSRLQLDEGDYKRTKQVLYRVRVV